MPFWLQKPFAHLNEKLDIASKNDKIWFPPVNPGGKILVTPYSHISILFVLPFISTPFFFHHHCHSPSLYFKLFNAIVSPFKMIVVSSSGLLICYWHKKIWKFKVSKAMIWHVYILIRYVHIDKITYHSKVTKISIHAHS